MCPNSPHLEIQRLTFTEHEPTKGNTNLWEMIAVGASRTGSAMLQVEVERPVDLDMSFRG